MHCNFLCCIFSLVGAMYSRGVITEVGLLQLPDQWDKGITLVLLFDKQTPFNTELGEEGYFDSMD